MRRVPNPYRPGFNQMPAELVGRQAVLDAAREALAVAAYDGRTPRPLVLVGVRGVGKTVTLNEIAAIAAEEHSWLTAHVECQPRVDVGRQLTAELVRAHHLLTESRDEAEWILSQAKMRASVLGLGGEVGWTRDRDRNHPVSTSSLDHILEQASTAALDRDSGLVVTIDELQQVRGPQLAEVTAAIQRRIPDGWPLVLVVAGLPTIREPKRTVTYLERGEWHELTALDPVDTRRALTEPARSAGRPLTSAAADLLVNAVGGYPYAIQVHGHHAWRASASSETITAEHVETSLPRAEADLASGLYAARWHNTSPGERTYLHALASMHIETSGPVTGGQVAAAIEKTPGAVSQIRDRLLKKGTLFAEGKNLRFCVPGMARWIVETQHDRNGDSS